MNSPEGKVCLEGQLHLMPLYHPPPPKAASGCGSMPGSLTGQQEVFSTAQMTQMAQIVSLSLNQAMDEFKHEVERFAVHNPISKNTVNSHQVCSSRLRD